MRQPELDRRSRSILLETLNEFVVTAEPVSSRTISRKLDEKLSPATVRNAMADLEELGFLTQPHTSAGRVPTDQGYRYFVNEILKKREDENSDPLASPSTSRVSSPEDENLQDLLGSVCHILSADSHQTSLVMAPTIGHLSLKRIEFIRLAEKQVLAVFVSSLGPAQNRMLRLEEDLSQDRLTSIANYLNTEFGGRPLSTIRRDLKYRIEKEQKRYDRLMKRAFDLWAQVFTAEDHAELMIEGINHLLDQPEFQSDIHSIKALLKTVEEKKKLIELLDLCMQQDGPSIIIGEEHVLEEMQGCSLIAQSYRMDSETMGTVAIVGPKRMDYPRMIEIVNTSAANISDFLSRKPE